MNQTIWRIDIPHRHAEAHTIAVSERGRMFTWGLVLNFWHVNFLGKWTWWFHQPGKQRKNKPWWQNGCTISNINKKINLESFFRVMWPHDINPPVLRRCHWLENPPSMLVSQTTPTRCWCLWTTWSSRHKLLGKGQGWYTGSKMIKHVSSLKYASSTFNIAEFFWKTIWCSIFHSHLTEENQLPIPNIPNVQSEVVSLQMKMAIPSSRPLHLRLEFVLFVWKTGFSAAWVTTVALHGTSWMECQTGFDKGPFEIWKFIPIEMCWTLAQDHSIQDDYQP